MRRNKHWVYIYSVPTTNESLGCIIDIYKADTDNRAALEYRKKYGYADIFRATGDALPERTWVTTNFHLGEVD